MDDWLKAKILDVLRCHHVMTLATIRPDGYPQATTVNYVHQDLTLFFGTDAASQKAANIKLNCKVSIAIATETEDLYKLRGLSMSGTAERVCDPKRVQNLSLLLFEELPQAKRLVPEDPKQLAIFAITPVAISLVDYACGYGKSFLVEL
jgi:nitroimidazol reductase NimA-like FMN-containing flavoprotein (pyridoxamine 5'-phosphate oxidase superfamily)